MANNKRTIFLCFWLWLQKGASFLPPTKLGNGNTKHIRSCSALFAEKSLPPPNGRLCEMLEALGLGQHLIPTSDLGYYGWIPQGDYRSVGDATKQEIEDQINLTSIPPTLVDLDKLNESLPLQFHHFEPAVIRWNKYPHGQDYAAALVVAAKDRGVDLDSVSFLFGSYTLRFLSQDTIVGGQDERCVIARIPGTKNMTLVTRYRVYEDNLNHFGPQFERLLTEPTPEGSNATVQHLHLMKIGTTNVLFMGQVDCLDRNGIQTELKYRSAKVFALNYMLQAIGTSSVQICKGIVRIWKMNDPNFQPPILEGVRVMATEKFETKRESLHWMGRRIRKRVKWLEKKCASLEEGEVKELRYLPKKEGCRDALMVLADSDVSIQDLFPNKNVMLELLN